MTRFDVGEQLKALLEADPAVSAIVGDRIWPNELPDGTSYATGSPDLPAIWYALVSDAEQDEAPIARSEWQVTCVAERQSQLQSLCAAVDSRLHRYKGGRIRYIDYVGASYEFDTETKTPYAPMTYRVTYY